MSSPSSIITLGIGSWGTPALIVTNGYAAAVVGTHGSITPNRQKREQTHSPIGGGRRPGNY